MKTLFYHICLVFAVVVMSALCLGCNQEKKYRIGVSQCSDDDWRQKMNEEIMREAMFHDNVEIEIRSADDSNEKQIADLQYFADNNFDIIVAAPNEAEPLTPIIKKIYESGKHVFLFDRNIIGDSFTAFQGADNRAIGAMAAHLAASLSPQGRVLEIYGLHNSSPAMERALGFDSCAVDLGLQIVGQAYGDWNYENALAVTDSLLNLHGDIDVIYAHNDRMAIAAADVARKHGLSDVKVIGIDAAPNIGIQAVADSVITATFLYPTEGQQLVRTALDIIEGRPYPKYRMLPTASSVDASNAEILLLQDKALRDETNKINTLKQRIDQYWAQHSMQTTILYGVVLLLILAAAFLFVVLRWYWSNLRHRRVIEAKNAELQSQRDELDNLYNQLQAATASKLTFFTNVSHDLRTPLTLIADPVEQLSEAKNLTEQQHTLALLANKNVKVLLRLINQILDFRKYENGKLDLNLMPVDLAHEIQGWIETFQLAATKRHINFSYQAVSDRDYHTAIDPGKMERALFNLLSNAFKFTPANGSVKIHLDANHDTLTLSVSDTGRGMSAEDMQHIFERFYMVDKVNPQGSGIGLAVAKAFVELHGGTISVDSNPGQGTTFTITIPRIEVEQPHADNATPAISASTAVVELTDIPDAEIEIGENTKTVLIIDDNHDICTLVHGLLSDKYVVIQASNGQLGLKMALKYIPDLVICDVMMPGIDGFETCRRLKHEVATSHIPVLLLTACALDEQRVQGYDCHADGYLTKPFNSRVLIAQCDSLIENRRLVLDSAGKSASASAPKSDEASKPAPIADASLDNEFYQRFISIVEREIANSELSVEDIADELGMSRVQMYRKIKAITNYSPAEIMRNLRLQRADRLLKSTEQNVSEVAYTVGFSSPSYFTKCYREYFGESPTDVQRRTSKAK